MSRLCVALLIAVAVQASLTSAGLQRRDAAAGRRQFPHQAWLEITNESDGGDRRCAGALISIDWVLTTASCVHDVHSINVYLGTFYVPYEDQDYYMHYSASSSMIASKQFDLGLVSLQSSAPQNEFVAPIRLPPKSYATSSYLLWKTTVSEYAVSQQGEEVTRSLLYSSHRVEPNFLCKRQYKSFTDDNLCLLSFGSAPTPATCTRGVGSPLIVTESDGKPTLIGLATALAGTTSSCGTVFSKVATHLNWIIDRTGIQLRD